jgi:serine O-acetyltransferase
MAAAPPAVIAAAEGTEALWREIRLAAGEVAEREPLLARLLRQMVLSRESLADALAAMLGRRLGCEDLPAAAIHRLFLDAVEANDAILNRAAADLNAVITRDPACPGPLHVLLNLKGFHALQSHRLAHWLWWAERRELAHLLSNRASTVFAVDIHPAARLGAGIMLDHATGIVIGETAVVGDDVSILQNVTLGGTGKERGDRHPKVRNGVLIGVGAKILGNIQVGAMSKVAAGSVVLTDVPPHSTVAGVPARVVRRCCAEPVPAFAMDQTI